MFHLSPLLPTLQSPLPKIYPSFVVERTSIRAGAWQKTCIDHQREVCWYTRTCHQRVGRVGWYWSGRYPLIQCILSLRHRVLVRISHSFTHAQRETCAPPGSWVFVGLEEGSECLAPHTLTRVTLYSVHLTGERTWVCVCAARFTRIQRAPLWDGSDNCCHPISISSAGGWRTRCRGTLGMGEVEARRFFHTWLMAAPPYPTPGPKWVMTSSVCVCRRLFPRCQDI